MHHAESRTECVLHQPTEHRVRERGLRWVVGLTAVMMLLEVSLGYVTGSMALLADGWHMATHVGALGLAAVAHALSVRHSRDHSFSFGTGKVRVLAGYTSAIALGLVALSMLVESAARLLQPQPIDYASALPIAGLGLVVNLVSVHLLHAHEEDHGHEEHDHNHRAAFMHVVADAFTSVLAIGALLAGRTFDLGWLDPVMGMVGGLVILRWGVGLARAAGAELLDVVPSSDLQAEIQRALEGVDDVRVVDLHLWPLGGGRQSCVVTVLTSRPRSPSAYRTALAAFELAHLTIEVQHCDHRPSEVCAAE